MSEKTLKRLVAVLVVALVLWGGVELLSAHGGSAAPTGAIAAVFRGTDPQTVTAVHIEGPKHGVDLIRGDGGWTVDGWAADSASVVRLLGMLDADKLGDLVASNPDNHARMGVASDSASTLSWEVDGASRTLLVGKSGPRYGTTYVRLPDDDGVYLMDSQLNTEVGKDPGDWRSKRVVAVDTAEVGKVEVTRGADHFTLARGDSAWILADGDTAKSVAVRDLMEEIHDLEAQGFLTPGDSLADLPQAAAVVVLSPTADTLAALTLSEGTGDRWIREQGDSVIYKIPGWRVDRIAPKRDRVAGG